MRIRGVTGTAAFVVASSGELLSGVEHLVEDCGSTTTTRAVMGAYGDSVPCETVPAAVVSAAG